MKITLKRLSGLIPDSADVVLVFVGCIMQGSGEAMRCMLNDDVLRAEVVGIEAEDDALKIWLEENSEGSGNE